MYTILVVDDSDISRDKIMKFLDLDGFNTAGACNGREGLKAFKTLVRVDLIIADINMPVMDGLTMIEEINQISDHPIPSLVISSDASERQQRRGRRIGVIGWILKPIDEKIVLDGVRQILQKYNGEKSE
jgi:two-component system chemotaxis response regulator CheY